MLYIIIDLSYDLIIFQRLHIVNGLLRSVWSGGVRPHFDRVISLNAMKYLITRQDWKECVEPLAQVLLPAEVKKTELQDLGL